MMGALPRKSPLLLLIALLLSALSSSLPAKVKLPEARHVHVGQLFLIHLGASDLKVQLQNGDHLPKFMQYDDQTLFGIPQFADIGNYMVTVTGNGFSSTINITAKNEFTNPCGDAPTIWIEYYPSADFKQLSLTEQRAQMEQQAEDYDVPVQEVRIYSMGYKGSVMKSVETLSDNIEKEPTEDSAVLLWRLSCSEVDEEGTNTISTAIDNDAQFAIHQGRVTTRDERKRADDNVETVTEPSTPMRTTRKADTGPVRMNSLPTFKCKRGIICVLNIPPKTFLDAEDGDETRLRLTVHATIANHNFLAMVKEKPQMRGVPMEKGDFGFRLEARDSAGQVASAPFRVTVEDAPSSNHRFVMLLEPSLDKLTKNPSTLVDFADRLCSSLYDRGHPEHIQIHSLEAKGGRSVLTWSNSSVSDKFCARNTINNIKKEMTVGSKNKAKVEFVRSMGMQFHVNSVALELYGNCDRQSVPTTPFTEVGDMNTSVVTVNEAEAQPAGDSMLLLIVLFVLLAVVLLIGALICWITFRRKAEQKKQSADYVSKGMPVVFPEEVPHEEENATVASPMLVKEERPPLVVSHHDNPLYKPPPPLAAGASPRPKTAASNQRLPPPYVPP
ncbi:hypothetical protein L596_006420 [Steinernema carpocapsae]|uniref:Peptidase S72 domain-containing protein n=1 Tax=Steinernema carpocapsae TaxID=34508 RepID=A0A4U8V490_STECR|nr:hypothetical protein L596_006420 [Steinernema carpocapsae]